MWLLDELAADEIIDEWEESINGDATSIDYQPRIGILTQPVSSANRKLYGYDHYILEVNMDFVRWSGSVPVVIPYDIEQQDLSILLPQLNGVLFTGGGLNLLDNNGRNHPYYETAKQIFNYSLFKKDVLGETWPVLGICQGLEVVSLILSGDVDTLDEVRIHGESRPI